MALYINGNKTGGGGGGGNSNIVDTSTPSQSVGNENDLYFKTGAIAGYYHYIVSTVSTSASDAIIQVQEISATGLLIKTTTLHHETSGSWTVFDAHFRVCYDSPFWKIEILDNNIEGYESGDIISWHYTEEEEYDLKIPVLDNSVTNQYIKIDNDWVEFNNSNMRELTQAEYDALTTEEKNNGTVYYITDGDDNNGGYQLIQPIIYSEEEREVGVWVDGKPLYQKTFIFSNQLNISNNSWVDSGLLSGDIENIIKGQCINDEGTSYYVSCALSAIENKIALLACRDGNSIQCKILTLQYTKTTDVAGSGKWTPQGTPAVHYSTEEQVVGTWINGKTVYEKTFYIPSMGNYDDSIDGYLIAENVVVDDLIGANGFIKIATGQNYGHSYVHITNGFSMLNSYEFALHLNDMGILLLWTDTSSLGGGIVGQELFITIQYTKPTT